MKNNKKASPLFLPATFFMIRIPLLPVDEFYHLSNQSDMEAYLLSFYSNDEILREAIAIASPTLHQALQKIAEKNKKERQQIFSSLLKYVLRMATRSTPFGLFACISQGKWDNATCINMDHRIIEKRCRPDMEWLMKVIDAICQNSESFNILPIKTNPLALHQGNRINLNYMRVNESDKKKKKVSIGATPLTLAIITICKQAMTVDQLISEVIAQNPSLNDLKVREVIRKLVEQRILLFTLHPSLLTKSPFQDLLAKLSEAYEMNNALLNIPEISFLKKIDLKISKYNCQGIGKGEEALQDIQASMETLAPSANFIQVDAVYRGENLTLNHLVAEELSNTAEVLWRLSFRSHKLLQKYYEKFIDKYGSGRKIPLLELLSEEGLGIPEIYLNASQEKINLSSKEKIWSRWLKSEWCKCLHERKKEIILTDQIIDKIWGIPNDMEKAPLSFDLYCEIVAASALHIDQGDFLLNISNTTWQAGSTFGRFIDILGKNTEESLKWLADQEERLEENSRFIESSYIPFPLRYGNVANHPNLRCHAIDFGGISSEKTLQLEDITVGILEDRFYLTLKGESEELIVLAGNVLNPTYAPIPLRFLRDVSRSRYSSMEIFSSQELDSAQFAPRIKYKKSILSPAQWKIDLEQIDATAKDSLEKLNEKFLNWAANWELPQYVFMTYGDNRILLDCQKAEHIREITAVLKKNQEVKLVEKVGQEQGEWVKSSKGRHFSEFVVPFLKNKNNQPSKKLSIPKNDRIPSVNRWKLPGSEWLFIKFYLPIEQEGNFLLQYLSLFANHCQEKGLIKGWFFVRYIDQSSHIRVRFHSEKDIILTTLIPAIHDWSLFLLQNKIISDVHIAGYERETDRYGGEEVIELAENFFCADASSAISLISIISEENYLLPDFAITALSLIDLLKGFSLSLQEMIVLLKTLFTDQSELKGFRHLKNDLLKICFQILENGLADSEMLHRSFKKRKEAQFLYKEKLLEINKIGLLSNSLASIQSSVLHMHCNRLLGNQMQIEKKACLYAYHTLLCLSNKKDNAVGCK